jgi:hypothetical protein
MATRTLIVRSTTGPAATDSELEEAQSEAAASPNIAYRMAYIEERKGDRDAALAWLARAPLRDAHLA